MIRDRRNHDSQRRDRILCILRPYFRAIPLLHRKRGEKGNKKTSGENFRPRKQDWASPPPPSPPQTLLLGPHPNHLPLGPSPPAPATFIKRTPPKLLARMPPPFPATSNRKEIKLSKTSAKTRLGSECCWACDSRVGSDLRFGKEVRCRTQWRCIGVPFFLKNMGLGFPNRHLQPKERVFGQDIPETSGTYTSGYSRPRPWDVLDKCFTQGAFLLF